MAEVTPTTFNLMYKAATLLLGAGLSKAAGTPGLLAILMGKVTENTAIPAAGGLMVSLQIPSLVLNMHSGHALALFLALRAEGKYSEKRDQLRNIQTTMDVFQKVIREAIGTTGTAPDSLPSTDLTILIDKKRHAAYRKEVDAAITNVNAYVKALDAVLDDIERCPSSGTLFSPRCGNHSARTSRGTSSNSSGTIRWKRRRTGPGTATRPGLPGPATISCAIVSNGPGSPLFLDGAR